MNALLRLLGNRVKGRTHDFHARLLRQRAQGAEGTNTVSGRHITAQDNSFKIGVKEEQNGKYYRIILGIEAPTSQRDEKRNLLKTPKKLGERSSIAKSASPSFQQEGGGR